MIIAITGLSATGKSTIADFFCRYKNLRKIVSCTTRPIRENEVDGVDYNFLTKEEYKKSPMILKNFIEDRDWYYGTREEELLNALDNKEDVVIVVDPLGAKELKDRFDTNVYLVKIVTEDKTRIIRSLTREQNPDVTEICKRYLRDKEYDNIFFEPDLLIDNTYLDLIETIQIISSNVYPEI